MFSLLVLTSLSYADCKFSSWNAAEYWCNGAVGYNGKTKQKGWAVDFYTTDGARAAVKRECPTCEKIYAFWNGCGAIAHAPSLDVYAFDVGNSADGAKNKALNSCKKEYTKQYQANARTARQNQPTTAVDNRKRRQSVKDPVPETTDCQVVAGACTTTYSVTYY